MTMQLTNKQLVELKAYLANYGLDIRKATKPRKSKIVGEGTPGNRPSWWHGTNCRMLDRLTQDARARGDWLLNLPLVAVKLNRVFSSTNPLRWFVIYFGRYNPDRKALTYQGG